MKSSLKSSKAQVTRSSILTGAWWTGESFRIEHGKSGTRKEELLYHPEEMQKIHLLRRGMKGQPTLDAMETLITRVKKTNTNAEFLMSISR